MVLGIIGVVLIAIAASKVEGYYGEETNVGVLVGWLIGGLLGLMLSLGFFFMGTRIMDGLAELIALNRKGGTVSPSPAGRPWFPDHQAPAGGMYHWSTPGEGQPVGRLGERVKLRVEETAGAWARVTGSNGWSGWVDGRLLAPLSPPPEETPPAAAP
jgi:hypothetical protein